MINGDGYTKTIEISDTGMVVAKVYNPIGTRVGLKFFNGIFDIAENRFIKAHSWADRHIKTCAKYEVLPKNNG